MSLATLMACSLITDVGGLVGAEPSEGLEAGDGAEDGDDAAPADAPDPTEAGVVDAVSDASCGPFSWPAASSFTDDFTQGLPPNWASVEGPCLYTDGGTLTSAPPADSPAYCIAYTATRYHLACDSLTFKVTEATTSSVGAQTVVYMADGTNLVIQLVLEGGGFALTYHDAGAIPVSGVYNPVQDAWWRFREQSGTTYFETSPDAVTWTVRAMGPTPGTLDGLQIGIGAGTWQAVAAPGRASFRCYNLPGSCP